MAEFLLELYASRFDAAAVSLGAASAQQAAEQLAGEGVLVRYLRSIFVPEDETCFHLYEAETADDVRAAARLAGLTFERISEAIQAST